MLKRIVRAEVVVFLRLRSGPFGERPTRRGVVKSRSAALNVSARSSTISTVEPRSSVASGPRVMSTPINPAAAPPPSPIILPPPMCPVAAPMPVPIAEPAAVVPTTVPMSPFLSPGPFDGALLALQRAFVAGIESAQIATEIAVTPLSRTIESKRTCNSPRPCVRPGFLTLIIVPVTQLP